ncbi:hypothetical protein BSKO_04233 [Bryopsis sp. KO-2023]|nr:hypothetical protein BSKO_04233 [Bryopsis sp. KO-2023]
MGSIESRNPGNGWQRLVEWGTSVGTLFLLDQGLASCFHDLGWTFPSPLAGMFLILATLWLLADAMGFESGMMLAFFQPGIDWVQKWLPLFYLAPLVVLPRQLASFSGADLLSIFFVVSTGWVANLWVTSKVTLWIRKITQREIRTQPSPPPLPESSSRLIIAWATMAGLSFCLLSFVGSPLLFWVRLAFMMATTVCGLFAGNLVQRKTGGAIHSIVTCAAMAHLGAGISGVVEGTGWNGGVDEYLPQEAGSWGAGTLFMSFLGAVILSFGCSVFGQRSTMVHHRWEIAAGITTCSLFSMFSTVLMGRVLGMQPDIILALTPRSVTVALALPIATTLGSSLSSVTAGAVVLTGLLGANFSHVVLDWFGAEDAIVRGIAAASSGHGLATAALGSHEPDALPFCSLAYALSGVTGTLFVQIPFVNSLLVGLANGNGIPVQGDP